MGKIISSLFWSGLPYILLPSIWKHHSTLTLKRELIAKANVQRESRGSLRRPSRCCWTLSFCQNCLGERTSRFEMGFKYSILIICRHLPTYSFLCLRCCLLNFCSNFSSSLTTSFGNPAIYSFTALFFLSIFPIYLFPNERDNAQGKQSLQKSAGLSSVALIDLKAIFWVEMFVPPASQIWVPLLPANSMITRLLCLSPNEI